MFTPETFIDSVQNTKRYAITAFVTNETIKKGLLEVVDAQTAFAKTVAKNVLTFNELFVKNLSVGAK